MDITFFFVLYFLVTKIRHYKSLINVALKYTGHIISPRDRVRNLKFATYLKFATCENTNKINELW